MSSATCHNIKVGDVVRAKMTRWDYDDLDITPPMIVKAIHTDEDGNTFVDLIIDGCDIVLHQAFVEDLIFE